MDGTSPSYAFRLSGRMGATTLAAFPDLVGEEAGSETLLTGPVRDCSALYGIIGRLESLGLELIEVRRITAEPSRPDEVDGPDAGALC